MAATVSNASFGARTIYQVRPQDVAKVLCHRLRNGNEQYLVRWKTEPEFPVPPRAICSWHDVRELRLCLHHVQTYIERRGNANASTSQRFTQGTVQASLAQPVNRKRKAPGQAPQGTRDSSGLLTPRNSSHLSRSASPSIISVSSSSDVLAGDDDPIVYNGVLQRKEGKIVARKSKNSNVSKVNTTKLPTPQMTEEAASAPIVQAKGLIRGAFNDKLRSVPNVFLENLIDDTTPSLDFTFIKKFVLRDGVYQAPPEASVGCQKPCKPNMGQYCGCEYTKLCGCLEYAAVNEQACLRLEGDEEEKYARYLVARERGEMADTSGLPKKFAYQKPKEDARIPSTLLSFYRESRHPIYECNQNCNCGPGCKSRLVQKGRKVPLIIFKTENRGWGVKCGEELIQGEFIDTYLGEVITNEEADRREAKAGKDKASYLYSLDKFVGDDETLTEDTCYVVDGQYMGGPTRFINHSCEPNCRQYTVSYNKHDLRIYDLAFFAYEDIPAGTELTFDYMDKDEEEEQEIKRQREEAANDPENLDKKPCNCGAKKCRGYLWV